MVLTSIVGVYRSSVPYFLIKIFTDLRYKTLVIDNSDRHYLYNILKKDKEDTSVRRNNTIFTRQVGYDKDIFEKFDYVFVLHGHTAPSLNNEILSLSNNVIFLTDYTSYSIVDFNTILQEIYSTNPDVLSTKNHKNYIVWKNRYTKKVGEKDIEARGHLSTTKRFCIVPSQSSEQAYVSLTHNGSGTYRGLGKEYLQILFELADEITENTKTKNIKKVIKRGR